MRRYPLLILLLSCGTALFLLGSAPAEVEEAAWLSEAVYVDDETCAECHEEAYFSSDSIHLLIRSFEVGGRPVGCEGCHGPGSRHAEEGDPALIRRFGGSQGDEACMSCHQRKGLAEWHASTHKLAGVGCTDCHSIHTASEPLTACKSCHGEVEAQFQLPSHHPVREGKMDCASCHDVHNAQVALLRTSQRLNDLCTTCHQAQEGPFIFEHPPVQEDCSLCHVPHGTVANNLLAANQPTLCLQCHDFHFHAGYEGSEDLEREVGGIERENPFGARGFNIAFTTSCTQCHSQIHGSDLPSQTVTGQGRGLTQ